MSIFISSNGKFFIALVVLLTELFTDDILPFNSTILSFRLSTLVLMELKPISIVLTKYPPISKKTIQIIKTTIFIPLSFISFYLMVIYGSDEESRTPMFPITLSTVLETEEIRPNF